MPNGSDIIIKGGSAEVHFDQNVYAPDPLIPHRYQNPDKKIVRVVITGDISYDSGEKGDGMQCEITVTCR
jgi:hypothetical protein